MGDQARGALYGLAAAALFGLSAPLAKLLLPGCGPLALAGLLYLGAGLGLTIVMGIARRDGQPPREAPLRRADLGLLAGIIVSGGILGPALMLAGLQRGSAVAGALLLNLEAPFTILLAVALFREHLGGRAAGAAALIIAGAALLGYRPGELRADWLAMALLAGACLCWALDNNLTQRLSARDPFATVRIKALAAGACNLALALAAGQQLPAAPALAGAVALGFLSYGVSIVLDMYALRLLGAAREAAYFAAAPFIGALAAVPLLGERLGTVELAAGVVMAAGVALLLTEVHSHEHNHQALEHDHAHVHDEHHQHATGHLEAASGKPHSHPHRHRPMTHDHPHVPDLQHRHDHG